MIIFLAFEFTRNADFGPYGWNDKNGRPLTAHEWADVLANPQIDALTLEAKALQAAGNLIQKADATEITDLRIPGASIPSQSSTSSKPLIEEVAPAGASGRWIVPEFFSKLLDDRIELSIILPDIVISYLADLDFWA